MSQMERVSMTIETELLEQFDRLRRQRGHRNRSEALRDLIRRALVEQRWEQGRGPVVGTLTVVYDHTNRHISKQIVAAGHAHEGLVSATLHIHLNRKYCLEVMALKGDPQDVRDFADTILGAKGVLHGDLVMTTMGDLT